MDFETGPYFCKNCADRLVVAPIAMRLCAECKEAALAAYATARETPKWETDQRGTYDMNPLNGSMGFRPGRKR